MLGPTASGKSALAIKIAQTIDAEIFSLDSLSIYKEINIASAKPKESQLMSIKHYGINELDITEPNNAMVFRNFLDLAIKKTSKKTLLITGGSSFYLKSIIEGLSPVPTLCESQKQNIHKQINALKSPYDFLKQIDVCYAENIKSKDTYRIHKALEIYFATHTPPSLYFATHPKQPFMHPIKLYGIVCDRQKLRETIKHRTQTMLQEGIIEEIAGLIQKYPKNSQPFKAIGPKECISYLEGNITQEALENLIFIHTTQLAKRQNTFNKTQFQDITLSSKEEIFNAILNLEQI
ncbi:tRNA (adenosine(37)-N6)-dimethylallyltransferase MiaA [Helicobacter sp. 11S03491-1]|uniref:tRNA (adenosine(37)-N6)-dimethylallyltransferase MiaA n=1 Tax=Helicobacter sp. 11S03491-1 TaxID=1476196 RepID=UPI0021512442|nr:tRNA (adenosine(37)-N6)-dimethylallyltransferase MiaA [Helicobacter sp. 11S03491-1]